MPDNESPDALTRVPTGVELTALDPLFRKDPHAVLARLRERDPVHYDDALKRWVLTRATDCDRVLRDRTMAVDGRKANEGTYMRMMAPLPGSREPSMIMLDPPNTRVCGRSSIRRLPPASWNGWRRASATSSTSSSQP